ncbi:hypothetical protein MSAN_02488200 [Mycena sanguinolenta]|uniref:Uncharacterized protein n=1 Tax=Mycena sanguinolenta TaxID=230812 RepID=A0A8H6WRJ2_9AGAR|nr:hypothetical protein MSAN_02488200 [Mycena sanguinolenta]
MLDGLGSALHVTAHLSFLFALSLSIHICLGTLPCGAHGHYARRNLKPAIYKTPRHRHYYSGFIDAGEEYKGKRTAEREFYVFLSSPLHPLSIQHPHSLPAPSLPCGVLLSSHHITPFLRLTRISAQGMYTPHASPQMTAHPTTLIRLLYPASLHTPAAPERYSARVPVLFYLQPAFCLSWVEEERAIFREQPGWELFRIPRSAPAIGIIAKLSHLLVCCSGVPIADYSRYMFTKALC